jgi:hypothetical protein
MGWAIRPARIISLRGKHRIVKLYLSPNISSPVSDVSNTTILELPAYQDDQSGKASCQP